MVASLLNFSLVGIVSAEKRFCAGELLFLLLDRVGVCEVRLRRVTTVQGVDIVEELGKGLGGFGCWV